MNLFELIIIIYNQSILIYSVSNENPDQNEIPDIEGK